MVRYVDVVGSTFPQAPSPTMTSFLRISDMGVVQEGGYGRRWWAAAGEEGRELVEGRSSLSEAMIASDGFSPTFKLLPTQHEGR